MTKEEFDKWHELYLQGEISQEMYDSYKNIYYNQYPWKQLPLGLSPNNYNAIMNFVQLLCGFGWVNKYCVMDYSARTL